MALSTSDLVADNLSASSVGGASGSRLALTSPSGPGVGAWLAEAWLATSSAQSGERSFSWKNHEH